MYTEENIEYGNDYEENYIENDYNGNKRNSIWTLLLRILIIFLCLLLVVWIISKFIGGKKVKNDGLVLKNNISDIRKASEKYFFLENNLPKQTNDSVTISLSDMNNKGLISEVKDYKGKVCSTNSNESFSTLQKTDVAYLMTVRLTCNEENKEESYYYDLTNGECLSCNGDTYMDGSSIVINGSNNNSNDSNNENNNSNNEDEISKLNINCNTWSNWTDLKLNDDNLLVKTRTLYKGVKTTLDSVVPVYGEWSEYQETPITEAEGIEIEVKQEVKETWSEEKTTTDYIENSDTIKVISVTATGGGSSCQTSTQQVRAKISPSEYAKYNSQGLIVALHNVYYDTDCDTDCNTCYQKVYDVTYKKQSRNCTSTPSVTTYVYQELVKETKDLYRSRTVSTKEVKGETVYSDWVEKLEDGYTKTDEKTQYSYKDTVCKG